MQFNQENKNLKLGKAFDSISDFKFPLAKNQIFTLNYNNLNYSKYIGIYSADIFIKENKKSRSILDD